MLSKPEREEIVLRTHLYPTFYTWFHCLAGQCRDDCCQGWNIVFNKRDYLAIKQAGKSPELEELTGRAMRRLKKERKIPELEDAYAEFLSHNGHCPFFNEQGLCALQLECGEQTLPWVCRSFPRKEIYAYVDRIATLSPACEGVLRLLWDLKNGVDFVMEDLPRREWRFLPRRTQYLLHPVLRERCIDILQTRRFSLERRLLILGLALDQVRREGWELDAAAWSARIDMLLSDPVLSQPLEDLPSSRTVYLADQVQGAWRIGPKETFFQQAFEFLHGIITSREGEAVFTFSRQIYDLAETDLRAACGSQLDSFFENLLVNIFFYLGYPLVDDPEEVWRSYVNLCNIWALLRFSAVVGYGLNPSLEGMFHGVVMASRAILHNSQRMGNLREELFVNSSADLPHLAVLIQG